MHLRSLTLLSKEYMQLVIQKLHANERKSWASCETGPILLGGIAVLLVDANDHHILDCGSLFLLC